VGGLAEEGVGDAEQLLGGPHVEVEQPRQREVDGLHLLHREGHVDAPDLSTSASVNVIGVEARNAAHSARENLR
jgi:hypothetical protein